MANDLEPIRARKHEIEKDRIVFEIAESFQSRFAVTDDVGVNAISLQQSDDHLLDREIVIRDKHSLTGFVRRVHIRKDSECISGRKPLSVRFRTVTGRGTAYHAFGVWVAVANERWRYLQTQQVDVPPPSALALSRRVVAQHSPDREERAYVPPRRTVFFLHFLVTSSHT